MSRRAWFLFIALGVIWGLPYFFIRIAVRELEPATLIFFRTALSALILLPIAIRRRKWASLRGHLPAVVGFTTAEIGIPWLLLGNAEQRVTSSFTGLVIAIVPLFAAAIAVALGAERLGKRRAAGLLLGIVGVVVLVGVDVTGTNVVAILELLGCAVGYASAPVLASRKLSDVPSFEVVTAAVLLTALAYLPFGVTHLPAHLYAEDAWSIVALAVVCTVVAFTIFFALIKEIGPARAVVVTYVNPAVAVLLGVLALNEPFTLGLAIGFPIILVGSVLGTWTPGSRAATVETPVATIGPVPSVPDPCAAAPLPDEKAAFS
ncbi:MAG: EamA family transporter [Acidimicrobiales bacterium]